ncbi:MAG: bifunctional (p)ppGpp synthetase/guanosine-3',5'-bis(diphosphate) 3'-pyrophosphohydrolase [Betaproteobacteria bacterium]|nr:bifunctional (p)ppGpp synthetase/guanosine-3',5'-bis(diphosphate) 3'-pyrophosphohydrolase [Betaproteobacteria bacterium]
MVHATHLKLVTQPGGDRAAGWLAAFGADFTESDTLLLKRALEWLAPRLEGRALKSGEPALAHTLGAASILRELKLDTECLAASLLAQVADAREAVLAVRNAFGARIAELAEGVARMAMIESLGSRASRAGEEAAQLEGLRKMLLAMAQDVRVVLVKLADHTQTMRFVVKCDDVQLRHDMARLALDIFAPLANRLGVWQLKWELEDLALRILEPETYKRIARLLDEKRSDRERYIDEVIARLREELERSGVRAEISGRPKHIYSIYHKMRRKGVDFDALHDVRAVRVLVNDVKDCYTALGIVHSRWTPLPKEFDDYIAKPKRNDYRSLHTAVIGPEGKPLEIQIRTHEMHQHSELGVAAHWRYKEGSHRDSSYDERIAWLRQIVEWKDEVADTGELTAQFRSELFADTIYVLTPQGRVIDLPKDATPIDFAYHVHTDLGHRCRGAKVDGAMAPLNTPLKNGQQVEITAAKQGGPSRDWLNPALGYLKSAAARAKVRQWFNRQNHEAAVAHGRDIVDKELQRHRLTGINLDKLAQQFEFGKLDDFLAEVGRGEIGPRQLQTALRADGAPPVPVDEQPIVRKSRAQPGGVLVLGVDKLLTVPAKCCKPAPPDPIIGFVSRGRGVTIHRKSCRNVARLAAERLVAADWGTSADATFAVDIVVEAGDRTGLLRDITEILSRERINVTATNTASRDASARMLLTVEINNLEQLNRVLALIRDVPGVAHAARR